jgi:hypothetical protein
LTRRVFSFNILGLLAAGVMLAAMFYPWWSFDLQTTGQTDIYPYLIDGPGSELVGYKQSPQMRLLTYVLGAGIGLAFLGSFVPRIWGRLMLGGSALLAVLGTMRLLDRLEGVAGRYHIPLEGHGFANYEGFEVIAVHTWLRTGYDLIVIGIIAAALAAIINFRLRIH